jgi:AcrR family transcriptional regulator
MEIKTTSDKIAATALRILEKEGPAAVSMRRVAKVVGITPMAIYHHFPNREALLQTITDREFSKLAEHFDAIQPRASMESKLLHVMDNYLDYALAHPRIFDYVFSQYRSGARRYPEDFVARRSPTLNRVADTVEEAMRNGLLNEDDVWEVALELWAQVHGYVTLYRAGRFSFSEEQFRRLYRRSLRRLLDGLKS